MKMVVPHVKHMAKSVTNVRNKIIFLSVAEVIGQQTQKYLKKKNIVLSS